MCCPVPRLPLRVPLFGPAATPHSWLLYCPHWQALQRELDFDLEDPEEEEALHAGQGSPPPRPQHTLAMEQALRRELQFGSAGTASGNAPAHGGGGPPNGSMQQDGTDTVDIADPKAGKAALLEAIGKKD